MNKRVWMGGLVLVLVCAMGTTGCRRRVKTTDAGADNIGGTLGEGAYGQGLDAQLGARQAGDLEFLPDIKFDGVLFDYDSAQVVDAERGKVEAVGAYLKGHAGVGVLIEGNCDERGSAEYNLALGERRALAVRAYLIGLGVDGAALQTKSNGEEKPVAMGHDESAWRLNRRAEFLFFKR